MGNKLTLNDVGNLQNESSVVTALAQNNRLVETAIENTLSRDGSAPNYMQDNLDMNSNRILNLPAPISDVEPIRVGDVDDLGVVTVNNLPVGGTTNQVLAKTSNANYAVSWQNVPSDATKAPLASPAFTGVPSGPTAAVGTNTTQFATTAYVQAATPYFSAYLSANQSTTSGPLNKILCNTEVADSNGWYDNITNYRFTPQLAGKYRVRGSVQATATTSSSNLYCDIYKNGVTYARYYNDVPSTSAAYTVGLEIIIPFNGTTDYVELFSSFTGTGTLNFSGGNAPIRTYFEGFYIGP